MHSLMIMEETGVPDFVMDRNPTHNF